LALVRPIIACASDPGDVVIDVFSGSATTGATALELGRRHYGIEISERFVELSRKRLAEIAAR
jgi:adenine-specific DNA-methyltransferase